MYYCKVNVHVPEWVSLQYCTRLAGGGALLQYRLYSTLARTPGQRASAAEGRAVLNKFNFLYKGGVNTTYSQGKFTPRHRLLNPPVCNRVQKNACITIIIGEKTHKIHNFFKVILNNWKGFPYFYFMTSFRMKYKTTVCRIPYVYILKNIIFPLSQPSLHFLVQHFNFCHNIFHYSMNNFFRWHSLVEVNQAIISLVVFDIYWQKYLV